MNGEVPAADGNGGWTCIEPGSENVTGKLWVIPRWENCPESPTSSGDRPVFIGGCTATLITFMNPGNATANATCYYFDRNGALLLGAVQSRVLGRGGRAICNSPSVAATGGAREGWALLSSNQDVLPTVQFEGATAGVLGYQTEAYPVDCNDDTGYEFVCTFAAP